MRKLLVFFLVIMLNSFTDASISNNSLNTNRKLAIENYLETKRISINSFGYNYLKNNFKITNSHIPTSLPILESGLKRISSLYGMRKHPIKKRKLLHTGIDFSGVEGTPILASANGTIEKVTYSAGYGNMVIINHGNNITSSYAHLKSSNVKVGDRVEVGQCIALLGNTGTSTGPHLHFEVRVNGNPINPLSLLFEGKTKKSQIISKMSQIKKELSNENYKYTSGFDQPLAVSGSS